MEGMDVDLDAELMQKFSCLGTTDKDVLIGEFQRLLGFQLSPAGCAFFLDMTNWYSGAGGRETAAGGEGRGGAALLCSARLRSGRGKFIGCARSGRAERRRPAQDLSEGPARSLPRKRCCRRGPLALRPRHTFK